MVKKILVLMPLLVLFLYGCNGQPVAPDRQTDSVNPEALTFQLAVKLADNFYTNPLDVPIDVPIYRLIHRDNFPLFASYALAAFDIYYEPADWDDWLTSAEINRTGASNFEPSDWDDWIVNQPAKVRYMHGVGPLDLPSISKKIDPVNFYEPSDWDDWLTSGNYEPSDWDDWLASVTINDLIALK